MLAVLPFLLGQRMDQIHEGHSDIKLVSPLFVKIFKQNLMIQFMEIRLCDLISFVLAFFPCNDFAELIFFLLLHQADQKSLTFCTYVTIRIKH